ncbi:cellulose binding domain-containing protein [Micromonospora endophytica]|uniref:Alpha-L-arabinofuranosidase n=1 Tax=Micromonospora endophytica TaxID=515350 RepID=A0A2W2C1W1_9ACTN|nr:cellulose binding domain-containing protein [Micromonospora endophytica]PZF91810.1 alpha-L-arabinofuranosidase [Micromonospora endophytica]RIW44387.1 alpha-L-arabinofuranosidase [Micromonospora endophytica]BCJ62411.1 alpha-L-arabinofuranosidase [Micromonospora endophytica]
MVLGTSVLTGAAAPSAGAANAPVTVTVNARAGLATMPETGLGVNHAIWDQHLAIPETTDLLKTAGVQMVRYPGGSYADIYHWRDHTAPGGYVAPGTDFDTFMAAAREVGAQPMIIANYGTGTPAEAADWVRYANVTKGYGARYWTVGNENYGNGLYGAAWEADHHPDKSATYYANLVVDYAEAMKAVDPTIKVGAVLTMPGNWPDGLTAGNDPGPWNQAVLSIAGPKIDFVDVHWYPGGNAAESLPRTGHIADAVHLLRQQIDRYAGPDAGRIGISLTEVNVTADGMTSQPAALFLADAYSGLLANGVFTVHWWNVHNGIGRVTTVAGQTDYGDFGLLSSGNCTADGAVCEPPVNTPFAAYHGLSMMSRFARTGDQFLRAGSDQPMVTAHAVRRGNGEVAVLLVNKDPEHEYPVTIDYAGFTPSSGAPTVHTHTNGATAIATSQNGSATSRTLPPYSLTTLVVRPANASTGVPGAPGQPTARQVTDRGATISWPAATPGASPIAKYEIHRQFGAVSEQLGETSGTSFTVGNLNPGSRYTINVLTRDTAGRVSWASPPLTFTTGSPANSACSVRFTNTTDWGNGYVASVDIANNTEQPIDGWTLTWTWPTSWQRVGSGWNANWAQTGADVRVTSTDDTRRIAAGGSVNVGFVGEYSGPNVVPTAFRLNGTLCTAR